MFSLVPISSGHRNSFIWNRIQTFEFTSDKCVCMDGISSIVKKKIYKFFSGNVSTHRPGVEVTLFNLTVCVCFCVQVHYILQEVVMGGMVLETNMNEIVAQVEVQNRMEKSEVSLSS